MHCKSVTANFFTLVGLLFELSKLIENPKGSLEAYHSIGKFSIAVTSNIPVISSSLISHLFFRSILRTNIIIFQIID